MSVVFKYLKEQVAISNMKQTSLDYIDDQVLDLVVYLQSSKFNEDTTVQVADVLRRLEGVRSRLCMHSSVGTGLPHDREAKMKTLRLNK